MHLFEIISLGSQIMPEYLHVYKILFFFFFFYNIIF